MSQEEKDNRLTEAIRSENISEVKNWLNKKANPDVTVSSWDDGTKISALSYAIVKKNTGIVKLLLQSGANPNLAPKEGGAALILASGPYHDPQIVQLLLEAGADPNVADEAGEAPLMYVCVTHGNPKTIKMLLDAKADPNARNKHDVTALMAASMKGQAAAVKLLLQAGANPNVADENGTTSLMQASMFHGDPKIIKMLLDAKADPNARNKHDATALIVASAKGHVAAVKLLLQAGADPNAMNEYNTNSLMAASSTKNKEIVELLLQAGADPNARIDPSWTKKENLTKLMASIELSKKKTMSTPLIFASARGDAELVHLLLKAGADPNGPDSSMNTPLLVVALSKPSQNNLRIAQMLLKAGADVNYRNQENKTAYDFAVKKGNKAMMILLKKSGANPRINSKKSPQRKEPITLFKKGGRTATLHFVK